MKSPEPSEDKCCVCSKPTDPRNEGHCRYCSGIFHLTWDTRLAINDCGQFDLDNENLAVFFTCNNCLKGAEQQGLKPSPAGQS